MDVEGIFTVIYSISKNKIRKNHCVQPLMQECVKKGMFVLFFQNIQKYEDKFLKALECPLNYLMNILRPSITGTDTNMRSCISPDEKLFIIILS